MDPHSARSSPPVTWVFLLHLQPDRTVAGALEVTWAVLFLRLEFVSNLVLSPPVCSQDLSSPALGRMRKRLPQAFVKLRHQEEAASPGHISARMKMAKEYSPCPLAAHGLTKSTWAQSVAAKSCA